MVAQNAEAPESDFNFLSARLTSRCHGMITLTTSGAFSPLELRFTFTICKATEPATTCSDLRGQMAPVI